MLLEIDASTLSTQSNSVEDFLHQLRGPRYFVLNGVDNSRTRVFVTLLHGNEPSGVMALWRWLKEGGKPAVRVVCIVVSVKTALTGSLFYFRSLPDKKDINRCFKPPYEGEEGHLAKAILQVIHEYRPEAVIDMHNTSGTGPAFAIATCDEQKLHSLAKLFTDKLMITHLRLGALMDISEESYPTVTIEVGGRLDQSAHDIAWQGVVRYFTSNDLFTDLDCSLQTIIDPVRIELLDGFSITYADTVNDEFDVTLLNNADQFNFVVVNSNTQLGWVNRGDLSNFKVSDCKLGSQPKNWLRIENGRLYPSEKIMFFMITTNPIIAIDDCLFYAVKP